jgi:hypothetical protein
MKVLLPPDFKEFIRLLNGHEVKYLLVGGYAVGMHGHPRYTGDMDVWYQPLLENCSRLIHALQEFGFSFPNLTTEDLLKEDQFIQLGYPPYRIDLISSVSGLQFDQAYSHRVTVLVEDNPVCFIGLDDLLINKKACGRHKDLDDVENLEEP